MPLPALWVDKLFRKLSATYGQAFLRQYDGVPLEDVKANWAEELGRYQQTPQAIARGLERLPADRAPTVLQFRELCRGQAEHEMLSLPAPAPAPIAPEVLNAVKSAVKPPEAVNPKAWAWALKEREERSGGKGMTPFQKRSWRTALGMTQGVRQ